MKVLVLNFSPRGGGLSKTEMMLNWLVEGMRDAGAEADVVALREKNIKNCIGCFTCWTKTPGKCVQKDDMTNDLLPKWFDSDLVVYATPLYNYNMIARLKTFIERTLPSLEPFFEIHEGRMSHPIRSKYPPAVMLAVSGMPDKAHFDTLSAYARYFFSSPGRKLIAEIYRPAAVLLTSPFIKEKAADVLNATIQAGRELVEFMKVSPVTMDRITQPLTDPEFFMSMSNIMWQTCIDEGVTPVELKRDNIIPRPNSMKTFMLSFPYGVNTKAIGERKAILQFTFSGEIQGSCFFTIEKGTVDSRIGIAKNPDLAIDTPFGVWMDIMTGKKDSRQMLMDNEYKVTGDISLMIQLSQKG